jgi:hypothetical protein
MYPKLKKRFGNRVTYAQSPKSHIMVEFSFDVVQVAAAGYAPEAYHSFIGFRVAKPLLERAFRETYGIEMKDIFFNEDLAIGTYRHAVATTIPEMTKVAWGRKRDEIQKVIPGAKRETVVFNLRRQQYEKEFGADYEKPHGFARFLGFIHRLIRDRSVPEFLATLRPNACSSELATTRNLRLKRTRTRRAPGSHQRRFRHGPTKQENTRWPMTPASSGSSTSRVRDVSAIAVTPRLLPETDCCRWQAPSGRVGSRQSSPARRGERA